MEAKKQLSSTYRLIRKLGINISEKDYGNITLWGAASKFFKEVWCSLLLRYSMYSALLAPFNYRKIRPFIWRRMGAKVGRNCYIGYEVYVDLMHADLITIEDNVHVDNRCFLLCHKRNIDSYCQGDNYSELGYKFGKITIKQGSSIGSGTMIMPGVTIGEGSIIGAGSLVTKDIPAWSVAIGRPAKVIKQLPLRTTI